MEVCETLYLGLYEKKDSEEAVAKMSPRPTSESAVLSVSLPPSVGRHHPNSCSLIQAANSHPFLPEFSSLTSDDIVLVMESAAMRRSFLRFLRGPFETQRQSFKQVFTPAAGHKRDCGRDCGTLSEGLLDVTPDAH